MVIIFMVDENFEDATEKQKEAFILWHAFHPLLSDHR